MSLGEKSRRRRRGYRILPRPRACHRRSLRLHRSALVRHRDAVYDVPSFDKLPNLCCHLNLQQPPGWSLRISLKALHDIQKNINTLPATDYIPHIVVQHSAAAAGRAADQVEVASSAPVAEAEEGAALVADWDNLGRSNYTAMRAAEAHIRNIADCSGEEAEVRFASTVVDRRTVGVEEERDFGQKQIVTTVPVRQRALHMDHLEVAAMGLKEGAEGAGDCQLWTVVEGRLNMVMTPKQVTALAVADIAPEVVARLHPKIREFVAEAGEAEVDRSPSR